jgi:hypothetical protein
MVTRVKNAKRVAGPRSVARRFRENKVLLAGSNALRERAGRAQMRAYNTKKYHIIYESIRR